MPTKELAEHQAGKLFLTFIFSHKRMQKHGMEKSHAWNEFGEK